MASLLEELKLLNQPAPSKIDIEDLNNDLTAAKVISRDDLEADKVSQHFDQSSLRKRTAIILADEDKRYVGKTISRKDLSKSRGNLSDEDAELVEEGAFSDSDSEAGNGRDEDSVDKTQEFEEAVSGESETEEDYENEDNIEDNEVEQEEEKVNEKMKKFSTPDTNELEKAKAVVQQIGLWDSFLENRICLQKSLVQFNKLPQHDVFEMFQENGGNELEETLKKTQEMLFNVLHNLMVLQQTLLNQNTETKNIVCSPDEVEHDKLDEDIPSDFEDQDEERNIENESDNEEVGIRESGFEDVENKKIETEEEDEDEESKDKSGDLEIHGGLMLPKKRKSTMTLDEYSRNITKRHAAFQNFRDSTIKKWNEKTKLASGKVSNKSFSSFDRSTLSQIKQILSDRERLIKRTQLKRSTYRVLGKSEEEANKEIVEQRNAHLKDYDTEIFDDDDFYHQLLREFIERKSNVDPNDPIALGRQWLEIQRLRNKVKRKVDTKASKGRRLRYDVHTKLVSFMAPQMKGAMADSSRNELFSSLFGKRQQTEFATDTALFT